MTNLERVHKYYDGLKYVKKQTPEICLISVESMYGNNSVRIVYINN